MFERSLPRHLRGLLTVDEAKSDSSSVTGKVKCTCGCDKIRLRTFGLDDAGEDDWKYGIKVTAECTGCSSNHLLFDQAVHGYDGYVCHSFETKGDIVYSPVICEKCGSEVFSAEICTETEDIEQFIEEVVNEYPDEFREEDYVDAFGWITMNVKCDKCGFENEIINLELS